MTKIYVGNLPFTATEDEVRTLFAGHGTVETVRAGKASPPGTPGPRSARPGHPAGPADAPALRPVVFAGRSAIDRPACPHAARPGALLLACP
jgi:hypothetical protein